jgi:hypothetical protein
MAGPSQSPPLESAMPFLHIGETDCVVGHIGLELRCANRKFISLRRRRSWVLPDPSQTVANLHRKIISLPGPGHTHRGRPDRAAQRAVRDFSGRSSNPVTEAARIRTSMRKERGRSFGLRRGCPCHRGKAAFVVMRVPESKLLATMGGTERVVNVENLQPARLHGGAELVNKSRSEPRRLGLARCILEARDSRLRGQRRGTLRTAPPPQASSKDRGAAGRGR